MDFIIHIINSLYNFSRQKCPQNSDGVVIEYNFGSSLLNGDDALMQVDDDGDDDLMQVENNCIYTICCYIF